MKSLNRTLSLVLVLAMVFGLMGVASASSFTDAAKVQYTEAVDVMTGIGAINGLTDGSFNPTGSITREEAAKLVTYTLLGAATAKTLSVTATGFSDVAATRWSAPYIAYCVSVGIINGNGDGTFAPAGNVTSYQLAKMLLVALSVKGEFTGTAWELNTAIAANKIGLFADDNATNFSTAATREEAALICFNAINYSPNATTSTSMYLVSAVGGSHIPTAIIGNTYSTIAEAKAAAVGANALAVLGIDYTLTPVTVQVATGSIANTVYGIKTATGIVTANQSTSTNAYTTVGGVNYNFKTGLDLVGHYVKVYYKSTYTSKDAPGVAYCATDMSTVVTVSKTIASENAWNTSFGTDTITAASPLTFTNFVNSSGAITGLTIGTKANPGVYVLYDNDIMSYVAPSTYALAVVTSYTAATTSATGSLVLSTPETITIPKTNDTTSATALDYAKYSIYATPAYNDVVTIATTGTLKTIALSKSASGKVTSINTSSTPNTITCGTTTYSKSNSFTSSITAGLAFTAAATMGQTCTFYFDAAGAVIAIVPSAATVDSAVVFVVSNFYTDSTDSYGVSTRTYKAQCVDMTGKETIYTTGVATTAQPNTYLAGAADSSAEFLCKVATTYNSTYKTDIASFTKVADTTAVTDSDTYYGLKKTNGATATSSTAVTIEAGHYYTSTTQFLFVKDAGTSMTVTTATGVQSIPANAVYSYYDVSSTTDTNYTVKYVVVRASATATAATGLMFVPLAFTKDTATTYTTAEGNTATAYKNVAFIDGQPNTSILTTDGNTASGFYTYTVDAQGIYKMTAAVKDSTSGSVCSSGVVTNVYGNYVTIAGSALSIADISASGAFIVDVPYLKDMLMNGGANGFTKHSTLSDLKGASVYYSFSTASDGTKTITGIYYMSAIHASVSPATHAYAADATDLLTVTTVSTITGDTYTYQWINAVTGPISGATAATYDPSAAGVYYCVVTDAYGYMAATSPATVAAVITATAASSAVTATSATLTATATVTGGGTVTYAWYATAGTTGTILGTSATLNVTGLTTGTAYATYHCVVTSTYATTVDAAVASFMTL